jgi:hypothetical protein
MVDKHEKQKTLAKALLVARFDGVPTPSPGRRARKIGGGATPFYSVSLAGNYLSLVINLTRSQIFSYDLLHHGLFYTA